MTHAPAAAPTTFYRLVRAIGTPLFRAVFGLRSDSPGRIPAEGGCIIAANHASYLDPLVLAATSPRPVSFMMTRRFWEMPIIGWASRRAGSFPVDEGRIGPATLRRALALLREGGVLGIFPEGRITTDGRLQPARPGVARLALRTGAPIVPAGIVGTRRALPKGRLLPRATPILVRYGEPIWPGDFLKLPEEQREPALTAAMMASLAALAEPPGPESA